MRRAVRHRSCPGVAEIIEARRPPRTCAGFFLEDRNHAGASPRGASRGTVRAGQTTRARRKKACSAACMRQRAETARRAKAFVAGRCGGRRILGTWARRHARPEVGPPSGALDGRWTLDAGEPSGRLCDPGRGACTGSAVSSASGRRIAYKSHGALTTPGTTRSAWLSETRSRILRAIALRRSRIRRASPRSDAASAAAEGQVDPCGVVHDLEAAAARGWACRTRAGQCGDLRRPSGPPGTNGYVVVGVWTRTGRECARTLFRQRATANVRSDVRPGWYRPREKVEGAVMCFSSAARVLMRRRAWTLLRATALPAEPDRLSTPCDTAQGHACAFHRDETGRGRGLGRPGAANGDAILSREPR
jgi:hypothetical protein